MSDDGSEVAPETESSFSYSGLVLPVAVSVLLLSLVFFFSGGDAALELLSLALATATVAGKFIVLRGLHDEGFFDSPYKLAPLVVYMDVLFAFVAVFNFGVLHRIPRLGRRLARMQVDGERILARNPWMKKVTFVGVVAFVTFPLSGTGAIGGAIVGRLLGLPRLRTLVAIATGAVIGAFGMALLADVAGETLLRLKDGPVLPIGGGLVLAGLGWWLWRNDRRARRLRRIGPPPSRREATPPGRPAAPQDAAEREPAPTASRVRPSEIVRRPRR